ncbi:DUF1330 domain-containing protein [Streptomyces sp. WG7]|uniref:DUF1330 domain-containing protein n=1 Tax=Streptomyces sp. WG7 TaxID=3417650 RepID=UPI003CEC58D8
MAKAGPRVRAVGPPLPGPQGRAWHGDRTVFEFASVEAARACYGSADYHEAMRQRSPTP